MSTTAIPRTGGSQKQTWPGSPLTTWVAIGLLGANLVLMLLIVAYIVNRLDLLNIDVGSISANM